MALLELAGLCGIKRDNNASVRLFSSAEAEVFKAYLPMTPTLIDFKVSLPALAPGIYTIKMETGENGGGGRFLCPQSFHHQRFQIRPISALHSWAVFPNQEP